MSGSTPVITFTTDYGLRDYFVAAMKGVILSLNPDAKLVDISNLIPPQDIFTGAFTLSRAWSYFPSGTVHIAIVDPGVGDAHKGLAVDAGGHFFVAPDNGILTYVLNEHPGFEAYEITAEHYYRKPVSPDFHARDIFSPIAAWISRGVPLIKIGSALQNPFRLQLPGIQKVKDTLIQGQILAVDRFGSLITNLKPDDVPHAYKILAGHREITGIHKTYQEGAPGEVFVVPGSTGYLEIAVKDGSAASVIKIKAGSPIGVVFV
ncbi:MAG: SAM-dependent chlorinase/fluorinase [Acidobacteria bacterium]|nr:SAM-dependent chlorinase/fluorinase [Acidobacteriota bacterium]